MNNVGILDKVKYLLSLPEKSEYSSDEIQKAVEMTKEHSNDMVLGRVFGYSVSDYAIATLEWIGTEESRKEFWRIFDGLSDRRKIDIANLIEKKLYLE